MISKVYAVFDQASMTYQQPFFHAGRGTAFRAFTDAVNTPESFIHKHPIDYALYELGAFDDATGHFSLHKEPERVVSALEVLSVQAKPIAQPGQLGLA